MAFLENTNYYSNWDDMSSNDQYLSSVDKFMYNTSDTVWNNASGCGYSNAAGGPSINVGGETFDMQPTLAWNQGDFFGQPQGFGASQTSRVSSVSTSKSGKEFLSNAIFAIAS